MPVDPYSTGIAAAGALANFFTGRSAAKSQKELLRAQKGLINQQAQAYKQAQPTYQQLLAQGGQYAGLNQMQAPGQWGTHEDQLRLAAAQDQINRRAQVGGNQLQAQLARRGIASGSVAAALAQNQRGAQRDLAGFQRQLAIEAPHEMERRRAALANLLQPAFGQGAAASAGYGQQAQQYGQQAQQAYSGIGDILQQYGYQRALSQQPQPYDYSYLDQPVTYGATPGYGPANYAGPDNPIQTYQDLLMRYGG